MGKIIQWLNRNNHKGVKWEDTEEGKRFYQKCFEDGKKRAIENAEWERNTPPEKKEQVKLFKIFVTIFLLGYASLLFWGFSVGKEFLVLAGEFILSMISLLCFFIKPKKIKYPNCFMMPVIAMGCIVILYLEMGYNFGFNPKTRLKKTEEVETLFSEDEGSDETEYSEWLYENNLIEKEEIYSKGDVDE